MYSYEVDTYLKSVDYTFSRFYDFENIRCSSPQVLYNLAYENDYETCLNVFTTDSWSWKVHILKGARV